MKEVKHLKTMHVTSENKTAFNALSSLASVRKPSDKSASPKSIDERMKERRRSPSHKSSLPLLGYMQNYYMPSESNDKQLSFAN